MSCSIVRRDFLSVPITIIGLTIISIKWNFIFHIMDYLNWFGVEGACFAVEPANAGRLERTIDFMVVREGLEPSTSAL